MKVRVASLVALAMVVACSAGSSTNPPASDGGGSGSGSGGSASGGSGGGSGGRRCPGAAPAANSACASLLEGLSCEFGTDPDVGCNRVFTCAQGTWVAVAAAASQTCPTPAATGACPSTYAAAQSAGACTQKGLACGYPQGRCDCAQPTGGPPTVGSNTRWLCDEAPSGCPSPRPAVGAACSASAPQECNYGACTLPDGVNLVCTSGNWQVAQTACAL